MTEWGDRMTKGEALEMMAILKAAYPNSYNGMTKQEAVGVVTVWALQFADIPADIVYMALQKAISASKFPPSINEVKERIQSLYWEAYDALRDEFVTLTEAEKAVYKRIENLTYNYRTAKTTEPRIKQMLMDSTFKNLNASGDQKKIGQGGY